jgi:hypothetical protein
MDRKERLTQQGFRKVRAATCGNMHLCMLGVTYSAANSGSLRPVQLTCLVVTTQSDGDVPATVKRVRKQEAGQVQVVNPAAHSTPDGRCSSL